MGHSQLSREAKIVKLQNAKSIEKTKEAKNIIDQLLSILKEGEINQTDLKAKVISNTSLETTESNLPKKPTVQNMEAINNTLQQPEMSKETLHQLDPAFNQLMYRFAGGIGNPKSERITLLGNNITLLGGEKLNFPEYNEKFKYISPLLSPSVAKQFQDYAKKRRVPPTPPAGYPKGYNPLTKFGNSASSDRAANIEVESPKKEWNFYFNEVYRMNGSFVLANLRSGLEDQNIEFKDSPPESMKNFNNPYEEITTNFVKDGKIAGTDVSTNSATELIYKGNGNGSIDKSTDFDGNIILNLKYNFDF